MNAYSPGPEYDLMQKKMHYSQGHNAFLYFLPGSLLSRSQHKIHINAVPCNDFNILVHHRIIVFLA